MGDTSFFTSRATVINEREKRPDHTTLSTTIEEKNKRRGYTKRLPF